MIKHQSEANIPTDFGIFKMVAFSETKDDWTPHIALIAEHTDFSKTINVRFHSECITGEVFHSKKCECGQQLSAAMEYLQKNGGMIIYLRQEGRNIGIINKLKAYALQEKGRNTLDANLDLNLPADGRDFTVALDILNYYKVKSINLLTNNPKKLKFVEESDIILEKRIPLQIPANKESKDYLETKKKHFGHLLT